jgi:hydroxymethylpyrimidine pyrophosphatase-like HAD family hydrolase
LPAPARPDGFLATGSVLQIAVALLRSYLDGPGVPERLPSAGAHEEPLRREVLVLTPPALAAVACDIEVRLVESGLAAVQVADYRNFAHGRHTGFARRLDNVTVIALSDQASEALASGSVEALPQRADVRRWHCDVPWPEALVRLLVRSMWLVGDEGERAGLDVARPTVPAFGRRLYRLPLSRRIPVQRTGAVERKLLALGAGDSHAMRAIYRAAADDWIAQLGAQRFGGVVLDYDGTVCWTSRRRELPEPAVREALQRLLEAGIVVAFASGRGQSLHRDLRRWLPEGLWPQVLLGLYNGAVRVRLDEALGDLRLSTRWSSSVVGALEDWPFRSRVDIEERGAQVTVAVAGRGFEHGRLGELVRERLTTAGVAAQVVASGHSLDIVASETSKTTVIDDARKRCDAAVLTIGDQGQVGGNDHAMLAHSPFSLTVDRCSADPSRCWYAGSGEHVGPDLLVRYLRGLRRRKDGFALKGLEAS